MKKYINLLLFIFLLLAGCSRNNGQQMSFLDTQTKINSNIQNLWTTIFWMWFSDIKEKKYNFDVFSENSDFKLQSNIKEMWVYNYNNNISQTENQINLNFFDKVEKNSNSISGNINNISLGNFFYTKFGDFYINIGTWNYQNELISLILSKISNKRIRTENPFTKIQNIQTDIKHIYQQILSSWLSWHMFLMADKTTYNGDLTYKILLSSGFVKTLEKNTDIIISQFQGAFVVHSASDVEFKIEKLYITGKYNTYINWFVSSKKWELMFMKKENKEGLVIKREQNKKNLSLFIKKVKNLNQLWWLNLRLFTKDIQNNQTEKKIMQINGLLSISPLLIYGSNLEKNIQIDINGQYEFSDIENFNILKPDSYILIDQILWDQFSLKTLQEKKEIK